MNSQDQRLIDAILREKFPWFLRRCMQTLNPGVPFQYNWHLDAIAQRLEQVRTGEVTRLIINMPPRSLKSITASVAFPAFLLGHNPRLKIFGISYGADLAAKHAIDFRSIVESDWYRGAFPQMRIKRIADFAVETTLGGFRKSTSTGATLTGLGGDIFIIDDPLKAQDAMSEASRNSANQWFSNTLVSRLDNKKTGVIVVVMQRVHLNDLSGYLQEQSDDWTVLKLASIADTNEQIPIGDGRNYQRRSGEVLHSVREPLDVLQKLQNVLGSDIFAAQYQQSPVPPGGAMIKRAWLKYYDKRPERSYQTRIVQSWDTAAKDGAQNDWSVCTTWQVDDNTHYYLLDLMRGRYEYPRLRETAITLAKKYKPDAILIEEASTGIALAQELRGLVIHPVKPIPVERDKVGRLYVQQAKFEAGLVVFPKGAAFLPELERELLTFPQSQTDDQVDSISQALAHKISYFDYRNIR